MNEREAEIRALLEEAQRLREVKETGYRGSADVRIRKENKARADHLMQQAQVLASLPLEPKITIDKIDKIHVNTLHVGISTETIARALLDEYNSWDGCKDETVLSNVHEALYNISERLYLIDTFDLGARPCEEK